MKVLQVSKFYWPVMGGIETVTWELVEGMNRTGLQVGVLCSNQRPVTQRQQFPGGYEVVRAASLGMLLSTSMAPAMVHEMCRLSAGRDIVHVHMPDPMAALAIWAARPKAKLVVHWHSDVVKQRRAMKFYEPLQTWLLARAAAIITTSPPYGEFSGALQPWRSKVEVIPIGISDNAGAACADQTVQIRQRYGGRRIIFALGRMTYYKGYEVLIEAAASLPEDCVVLIGGDGELLQQHRALIARRGLQDKVHLLGHVPNSELPTYYHACDVFCMPSTVRSEAYGVSMVEAMVMGKAIVASDIAGSGVPWVNVNGGTGLNTPASQPAPMAAALLRLLDDTTLRERLGVASRQRYLQEFNAKLMTKRTISLYQRLLAAA